MSWREIKLVTLKVVNIDAICDRHPWPTAR